MKSIFAFGIAVLAASSSFASGADNEQVEATYEVPVTPDLAEYAKFPIEGLVVRKRFTQNEIRYLLPIELTGRKVEIRLRESKVIRDVFSGRNARALCEAQACELRYPGLELDENKVRELFESRGLPALEIENRMKVFEAFRSGDPAGIIHFTNGSYKPAK